MIKDKITEEQKHQKAKADEFHNFEEIDEKKLGKSKDTVKAQFLLDFE